MEGHMEVTWQPGVFGKHEIEASDLLVGSRGGRSGRETGSHGSISSRC